MIDQVYKKISDLSYSDSNLIEIKTIILLLYWGAYDPEKIVKLQKNELVLVCDKINDETDIPKTIQRITDQVLRYIGNSSIGSNELFFRNYAPISIRKIQRILHDIETSYKILHDAGLRDYFSRSFIGYNNKYFNMVVQWEMCGLDSLHVFDDEEEYNDTDFEIIVCKYRNMDAVQFEASKKAMQFAYLRALHDTQNRFNSTKRTCEVKIESIYEELCTICEENNVHYCPEQIERYFERDIDQNIPLSSIFELISDIGPLFSSIEPVELRCIAEMILYEGIKEQDIASIKWQDVITSKTPKTSLTEPVRESIITLLNRHKRVNMSAPLFSSYQCRRKIQRDLSMCGMSYRFLRVHGICNYYLHKFKDYYEEYDGMKYDLGLGQYNPFYQGNKLAKDDTAKKFRIKPKQVRRVVKHLRQELEKEYESSEDDYQIIE